MVSPVGPSGLDSYGKRDPLPDGRGYFMTALRASPGCYHSRYRPKCSELLTELIT